VSTRVPVPQRTNQISSEKLGHEGLRYSGKPSHDHQKGHGECEKLEVRNHTSS